METFETALQERLAQLEASLEGEIQKHMEGKVQMAELPGNTGEKICLHTTATTWSSDVYPKR